MSRTATPLTQVPRTPPRTGSSRGRLLLVRQPIKSVRAQDHPDRGPFRLAVGVVAGVGVVGLVWLIGYLGYRLGFAPLVMVPELVGEPGLGLASGVTSLIAVPQVVLRAGMSEPGWLMIGFAMITFPAAALAAAKPATPGGPRQKPAITAIASSGAVLAMISAAALLWWTSSPLRRDLLSVIPLHPDDAVVWLDNLQTAAGLDVLATVSAAVWLVLVFRLPIPRWLRAIAASAACFTLVVAVVGLAISSVAATQIRSERAVCRLGADLETPRIMLGSTPHHLATLTVRAGEVRVELTSHPETLLVDTRQSIIEYVTSRIEP